VTTLDRPRFALFDSLRAIAALSVLAFHAGVLSNSHLDPLYGGFTSHLNVGVALFFLLSGFLLYRPYAQTTLEGCEQPSLRRYSRHRFLRIVPAYWTALTLLGLWPGLDGVFTRDWWVYYGFLQSYQFTWLWGGIAPAWSLSTEVAFYAFLPGFGAAAAWMCRGGHAGERARLQAILVAVLAVSGLAFHYAVQAAPHVDLMATLPASLSWFAAGMALALASARFSGRESDSRVLRLIAKCPGTCWALALAVYAGIAITPIFPRATVAAKYTAFAHTLEHLLYAVVALLVMLPAVFGQGAGGFPRRLLANRVLTWLGVVSYGIFLWHNPLQKAMAAGILPSLIRIPEFPLLSAILSVLPATVLCSWLSYRLIERPAMKLADRRRNPRASASQG
jgi:peptidoglycan/LPS O-acetylase OafA/YrhL